MRGRRETGGWNIVSVIPRGWNTTSRAYSARGFPDSRRTISPEQNEIDVAVGEALPGPGHRLVDERQLDPRFVPAPGRLQVQIGPQAGEVRQQLANGDFARAALEFRQVLGHPVVEPELAFLEQLHDRGVVATTLVREAASKMVSTVMASRRGVSERAPYALRCTI